MSDREKVAEYLETCMRNRVISESFSEVIISLTKAEEIFDLLKEQKAVEPKTGHWFKIHGGTAAQCTICKCWGQINMKFCPWCGAKMET